MPVHVYVFAAVAIASVPLFVYALRGARLEMPTRGRRAVRANLGAPMAAVPNLRQVVLEQHPSDRILAPMMEWLTRTGRRLTPVSWLENLEQRRNLAGGGTVWTLERLLAVKLVLGVVGGLLALLVFASNPSLVTLVVGGVLTMGAFMAPDLVLGARGRERQKEIERSFPGVLDQLTICVEAGLGIDAALARAAHSGKGPLADELSRVMQDIQLGVGRQVALEAMVKRTDVPDIRHFVVSLGQANRYGVPVVQALRVQASDAREQRRSRAEERAQKLSVKLLFPLVFCILPSLFVVLLGPAAIRIAHLGLSGGHH